MKMRLAEWAPIRPVVPAPINGDLPPREPMSRLALVTAAALLASSPGYAQTVTGTVLDDDSGHPVPSVHVELRTQRGRALTAAVGDTAGEFQLQVPEAGVYRLRATRLGYQNVDSPEFEVAAGEQVVVHLAIASSSVPLTPLVITSRPEPPRNLMLVGVGFYQREQRGGGTFVRRERIERNNGGRLSDVLSEVAGIRRVVLHGVSTITLNRQRSCSPQVVVDGLPLIESAHIDDIVAIRSIEAIEVYRGPAQTPIQVAQHETGCGMLVIWTRSPR
jgi:hypothetical protein